jgi:hypothetical protein
VIAQNESGTATNLHAELVSEKDGQFGNGGNRNTDIADSSESGWFFLRLEKTGDEYAAEISDGGVNWTSLGQPVTNDAALTTVGLMAIGPEQTAPVTVGFDYFRVGSPDRTAPAVEVAVSTPDGANGWHRGPATVTATAADDRDGDVRVDYRAVGGEWTAYAGPVVLDQDGSHALEFRATDAAGNTSAAVPATALVDRSAPAVSVTGVEADREYVVGTALTLGATADDPGSGVTSVLVELDGRRVQTPLSVAPAAGAHELRVVATDEAGNAREVTVPFVVSVTWDTAADLLVRYRLEGKVGLASYLQLYVHLVTAEHLSRAGLERPAAQALDRFTQVANTVRNADTRAQLVAVATVLRAPLTG